MKSRIWVIVTILSLLAITIVGFQLVSYRFFDRNFLGRDYPFELPPWSAIFFQLLLAKIILSSLNSVLLTILLVIYIGIYRETESRFSLGLIMFSIALLLYSLTSNPLIHGLAGFMGSGLGPFTILPDLFTCIASAILLYLSRQ